MKLKLKSARQQIKENEAARDAQFLEDYPDGRYALKLVFRSEPPMSQTYYTIHWKKQRWNRGLGVRSSLVINADAPEKSEQLKNMRIICDGRWDTLHFYGKMRIKFFTAREPCLTHARKLGFPEPLISAFNELSTGAK